MSEDPSAVWCSVSNMLIQNRCWICLTSFPRGKKRKTFMIQDILNHFERRRNFMLQTPEMLAEFEKEREEILKREREEGNTDSEKKEEKVNTTEHVSIQSEGDIDEFVNVKACWDRYQALEGNHDKIVADLKAHEIELWMSGLACCRTQLCDTVFNCIIPPPDGKTPTGKKKYATNIKDCPPGCGCDNPWPFMG